MPFLQKRIFLAASQIFFSRIACKSTRIAVCATAQRNVFRQCIAGERGQEFLVRRRQRNLLHLDVHARMRALEFRQQLRDNFAFAADGPERERGLRGAASAAGADGANSI